jgi:hypothetical protein
MRKIAINLCKKDPIKSAMLLFFKRIDGPRGKNPRSEVKVSSQVLPAIVLQTRTPIHFYCSSIGLTKCNSLQLQAHDPKIQNYS